LCKEYRPFSTSLRNFFHSPVTSSLLGPNILLSTLFSNTSFHVLYCLNNLHCYGLDPVPIAF
jgi:hypothetical protein